VGAIPPTCIIVVGRGLKAEGSWGLGRGRRLRTTVGSWGAALARVPTTLYATYWPRATPHGPRSQRAYRSPILYATYTDFTHSTNCGMLWNAMSGGRSLRGQQIPSPRPWNMMRYFHSTVRTTWQSCVYEQRSMEASRLATDWRGLNLKTTTSHKCAAVPRRARF